MESTYVLCMPRPAKAAHVLAKFREELGLHQNELAKRVGLHRRTIQDIERGKLHLSRRSALRISEKTGVSVDWLQANDPKREIINVGGKPWSNKDRQTFDRRNKLWPTLSRITRRWQLAVCVELFKDYLGMRSLLEGVANPGQATLKWRAFHRKAVAEFIASYEPITKKFNPNDAERFLPDSRDGLSVEALQTVRDDVDAVLDDFGPIDEGIMARLCVAIAEAGRSNPEDVLKAFEEMQEHPKPAPSGTPLAVVLKGIEPLIRKLNGDNAYQTKPRKAKASPKQAVHKKSDPSSSLQK